MNFRSIQCTVTYTNPKYDNYDNKLNAKIKIIGRGKSLGKSRGLAFSAFSRERERNREFASANEIAHPPRSPASYKNIANADLQGNAHYTAIFMAYG